MREEVIKEKLLELERTGIYKCYAKDIIKSIGGDENSTSHLIIVGKILKKNNWILRWEYKPRQRRYWQLIRNNNDLWK